MSAENLRALFWPKRIAVIGASPKPGSIGGSLIRTLLGCGFRGDIHPVNPRYTELLGLTVFPGIADVPQPIDVALVVVPAATVPAIVAQCADAGVSHIIIISSNFGEGQGAGKAYSQALAEVISRHRAIRVCGPNAEGILNTWGSIAATFSPALDPARGGAPLVTGNISIVAQSGGVAFGLYADGIRRGLGFGFVVSSGNEIDLEMLDYVEYALTDPETSVVAMLVEGFRNPERLADIARQARHAHKHLVVAKLGTSDAGRRAALAHTAHETGDATAVDAELQRLRIHRAHDQEDLIDIAMALSRAPAARGGRIGVLTLSGGAGGWVADALTTEGLTVPELAAGTMEKLRAFVPEYGAVFNPIDATAQVFQADGGLSEALETLLASSEVDAVVLTVTLSSSEFLAREEASLARLISQYGIPIVVYTYSGASQASVELLQRLNLPWYSNSRRAARAIRALVDAEG
jgi:acyl-CoA synthetase (NDP forming)